MFEHGSPFDPEELSELNLPDDLVDAHVAFNLCYWRPHVFGLEAEPEVARFVERFDLEVLDEQQPDEGHVYSAGRFLEGWNEGNEAGYQVGAAVHPDAPTLPTSEIRRCWEWNRCVIERQASSLGERVFVAKIAFLREGGVVQSYATWADAMPILLPRVDLVAIVCDSLAQGKRGRHSKSHTFVEWSQLEQLSRNGRLDEESGAVIFDYPEPPSAVVDFFRSRRPVEREIRGLAVYEVKDAELMRA